MDQVGEGVFFHCFKCKGEDFFLCYIEKQALIPACKNCGEWFFAVHVGPDFLEETEERYLEGELKELEEKYE